ncbi:hypothetical protein HDU99_010556 [Rhizoclosmatium hyalinum]|nr:hypothetical protein HDU99_010556 [Rhizoclosmatium hyalinum]
MTLPTPSHPTGAQFSVSATATIAAPAESVFSIISDLDSYSKWSTYASKATRLSPSSFPLSVGDQIKFHVHLDKDKDGEDQIDTISVLDRDGQVKRLSLVSSPFPTWILWAEKVQEVHPVEGDPSSCVIKLWISMGGSMGVMPSIVKGVVGKKLELRFKDYVNELKEYAERQTLK